MIMQTLCFGNQESFIDYYFEGQKQPSKSVLKKKCSTANLQESSHAEVQFQ